MRAAPGSAMAFLRANVQTAHGPNDPCVVWPEGWAKSSGYGAVKHDGRMRHAHAVLCELRDGPAPEGKPMACHGCTQKLCVVHVYWGDDRDQWNDKLRDNTDNRGEHQWNSKLTSIDVTTIRGRLANGETARRIALSYPQVTAGAIDRIARGKTWAWLT